jgi:hypothetical protein
MTIDPKKIREIALVCATLSKSAPTAEERGIFANPALKSATMAMHLVSAGSRNHGTSNPYSGFKF